LLADWEIIDAIADGNISIEPFNLTNLNPHSYDITLGNSFFETTSTLIDPRSKQPYGNEFISDLYYLQPLNSILGTSVETIKLANGFVAQVHGKSSIARFNIEVHHAGLVDSGFEGEITFEVFNANNEAEYLMRYGDLFGQVTFHKVEKSKIPYNKKVTSKYMNEKGATPSLYWKNYEG